MRHLLNAMARQAALGAAGTMSTRLGTVTSYDPNLYCVKVLIEPEEIETGWIPVTSAWVGNGWGIFCPPSSGDLVELQFQEGDIQAGVACSRFFTDDARPLPVPSGELWLVHGTGAFIKLLNSGKVSINCTSEIDLGNVGGTLHALVTDALVSLFNGHTHAGGATPDQHMGSSHLTSILRAN